MDKNVLASIRICHRHGERGFGSCICTEAAEALNEASASAYEDAAAIMIAEGASHEYPNLFIAKAAQIRGGNG